MIFQLITYAAPLFFLQLKPQAKCGDAVASDALPTTKAYRDTERIEMTLIFLWFCSLIFPTKVIYTDLAMINIPAPYSICRNIFTSLSQKDIKCSLIQWKGEVMIPSNFFNFSGAHCYFQSKIFSCHINIDIPGPRLNPWCYCFHPHTNINRKQGWGQVR